MNTFKTILMTTLGLILTSCHPVIPKMLHFDQPRIPLSLKIDLLQADDISAINRLNAVQRADIHCLTLAIYGEARDQGREGLRGVAFSILHRTKDPQYPDSICQVVLQRHQYEPLRKGTELYKLAVKARDENIFQDPKLHNSEEEFAFYVAQQVAYNTYLGYIPDTVNGATHFYSPKSQQKLGRNTPKWATVYNYVATIGDHVFYAKN